LSNVQWMRARRVNAEHLHEHRVSSRCRGGATSPTSCCAHRASSRCRGGTALLTGLAPTSTPCRFAGFPWCGGTVRVCAVDSANHAWSVARRDRNGRTHLHQDKVKKALKSTWMIAMALNPHRRTRRRDVIPSRRVRHALHAIVNHVARVHCEQNNCGRIHELVCAVVAAARQSLDRGCGSCWRVGW
jgi:hypothetical protein